MGTTLYIDPLIGSLDGRTALGGMFAPVGQKLVHVPWPNGGRGGGSIIPSNAAAHTGMTNLYNAVVAHLGDASVGDPLNVIGHSGGAQIIMKMLREKRTDLQAAITAAGKTLPSVVFYPMGCPEQKFTGASYLYPEYSPPIYPGNPAQGGTPHTSECPTPPAFHGGYTVGSGLPSPCPFTVHVVSTQYDGWSMAPTNPDHPWMTRTYDIFMFVIARKMWDHSIFCALKSSSGPHGRYDTADSIPLSDPGAVSYTDPAQPTVKYWYLRTYPFPAFDKIKWLRFMARDQDKRYRPTINAAYGPTSSTRGMQVTVPLPDYTAVSSWF